MIIEENVFFPSDGLTLHGGLSYNDTISNAPAVILCPPHPQLGGNMENNVIMALHERLAQTNFVSLRFDYRGVGKSEGADDPSEIESLRKFWEDSESPMDVPRQRDAAAALDYLMTVTGVDRDNIFLVGYSFGAYAALQVAVNKPGLDGIVLIAPTVGFHDFSPLCELIIPKLVIHSDNDFSCEQYLYEETCETFSEPKQRLEYSGSDHFFIGHEKQVSDDVTTFLTQFYS